MSSLYCLVVGSSESGEFRKVNLLVFFVVVEFLLDWKVDFILSIFSSIDLIGEGLRKEYWRFVLFLLGIVEF